MIFKLPRKRWVLLAAVLGTALAVAVPVAWATFTDVPPGNPFYADINAIQGAGITTGCGGGNFCPNDNITRQAEAAFAHRGLPRTAQTQAINDGSISFSDDFPTDTVVGFVSIAVPGVAGGTQFIHAEAHMSNFYSAGSTRPFLVGYYIADGSCTGPNSGINYVTIPNSNPNETTASTTWTEPVGSGTTHTLGLCAFTTTGDGVAGTEAFTLDLSTVPFGASGGSALATTSQFGSAKSTDAAPASSGRR
jgi:predicted RNA-binding protein with TRAM domain